MRRISFSIALGVLAAAVANTSVAPAFAAGDDPASSAISCRNGLPGSVNCIASKKDVKEARSAYDKGVKLQKDQRPEEAFTRFDEAARLAPQNVQFLTAREVLKAQLVFNHIQRGNLLLLENARIRAAAEFRAALDLDGDNEFARERLVEASRETEALPTRALPVGLQDSGEIHLQPKDGKATFHYSGDVRGLYAGLSAAYGVTAQFDDRSEEHTSELQSPDHLVCRLLLEKKNSILKHRPNTTSTTAS